MDSTTTPEGWIYCLSNPCMPGILKVGMTERTPEERIKELYTTGVALPFKVEFAKKVKYPKAKESTLHILLEQYTDRINPRREFFRVSPEEIMKFFDLMDGEMLTEKQEENIEENIEEEDEEDDTSSKCKSQVKGVGVEGERNMRKCFTNGQRIRHTIGINKTWVGIYDSTKNAILHDGKIYTSPSNFGLMHIRAVSNPNRMSINGWTYCECEVDGKWISTYSLPSKVPV
jgi:hypothetical protein